MRRNGEHPSHNNGGKIAGALVIGTILSAAAAFLITTKKGKKIRHDLVDIYDDISEQTHYFIKPKKGNNRNLLIASVAGGILGISAIAFLASHAGQNFRDNLTTTFKRISDKTSSLANELEEVAEDTVGNLEEKITPWVKIAGDLASTLSAFSNKKNTRYKHQSAVDTVADWAGLGIRLFQSLKK